MTDFASLLVQVQQRYTEFLARLSNDDLLALAEGRLQFALVDPTVPAAGPVAPAAVSPVPVGRPPAPKPTRRTSRVAAQRPPADEAPEPVRRTPAKAAPRGAIDPAQVAAKLRGFDSVDDGLAYLDGLRPLVNDLKLIGAELGVRISGTKAQLTQKILTQAIGARRKFAGLRTW